MPLSMPETVLTATVFGTDSVMRMPEGLRKEYREMTIRKTPNATVRILRSKVGTRWMMKTPLREKRTVGRRIRLNRMDLDVPQVLKLSLRLREEGFDFPFCYRLEDAERALLSLLKGGKADA